MGWLRTWFDGEAIYFRPHRWVDHEREHARIIEQCKEKSSLLIGLMQMVHAETPNTGISETITALSLRGANLNRINVGLIKRQTLTHRDQNWLREHWKLLRKIEQQWQKVRSPEEFPVRKYYDSDRHQSPG